MGVTTSTVLESWLSGWVAGQERQRSSSPVVVELETRPSPGRTGVDPSVTAVTLVGRERSRLDASMLRAVHALVQACRKGVLDHHGWHGVDLSPSRRRTAERDTKRRAVTEVQAALGLRIREATSLVGLAMAPGELRRTVIGALDRGETSWSQARRLWETVSSSTRGLTQDQQLLVTLSLHGVDPALAAPERLDPEGELVLGDPWDQARFEAALDREVTACEGTDVVAERERRHRAYRARRARVHVHDDGTATLVLSGPITQVLAVHARHDTIARSLRAQGHPDSLAQLAADSMLTTLAHGTLDIPTDASLEELAPEHLDDLVAVVNGHPRVALQVIVPADALGIGHPVCATCATDLQGEAVPQAAPLAGRRSLDENDQNDEVDVIGDPTATLPFDREVETPWWARPADPAVPDGQPEGGDGPTSPGAHPARATGLPPGTSPTPSPGSPSGSPSTPPPVSPPGASLLPPTGLPPDQPPADPGRAAGDRSTDDSGPGRGLVAEILGSHPAFITPGHVRELFYTPGTTLHRILTDPADGRCVERTITSYRPDADMRRQVRAADVYSRHPSGRLTGKSLEIDHVIPYGTDPGGVTRETNLADLDKRTHKVKTLRELSITINTRRDLTFTTLLGQITRSRTHDYRQYLLTAHPHDLDDRRDLADQALYAALATHPDHRGRPAPEAWLTVDHVDRRTGRRRPGPPDHVESVDGLLRTGAEARGTGTAGGTGDAGGTGAAGGTDDAGGTGKAGGSTRADDTGHAEDPRADAPYETD